MVKLINCSGFAQTGCTAQVDVLAQYHSVEGVLKSYNEFGVLKLPNSFAAVILSDILGQALPSRDDIGRALMGKLPKEGDVSWSYEMHMKGLQKMAAQYGEPYEKFTQEAIDMMPESFVDMSMLEKFEIVKRSFGHWIAGIRSHVSQDHFKDDADPGIERVLGLKNDPVGAHPILTGLLPEGALSSAIIRDPRDTNVDFNRNYSIEHTEEATRNQCRIYLSQIRSSLNQVRKYRDMFEGKYFIIEFERLVKDEDYRNRYVKKMVGDRPKIRDGFDPEISINNIGMYKNYEPKLIEIVEEECMVAYEDFLTEMQAEGLLMA